MRAEAPIPVRRRREIVNNAARLAAECPEASALECIEAAIGFDLLLHGDRSAPVPRVVLAASHAVLEQRRRLAAAAPRVAGPMRTAPAFLTDRDPGDEAGR
jgi:hypothetical protein